MLAWVLVAGKWTVIITELIVVGAFLMRFGLDRKLTDLRKGIQKEVVTLESYGDIENEFTIVQKRLSLAAPIIDSNNKEMEIIGLVSKLTPAEVWLENFIIQPGSVTINAKSVSLAGFGQFITGLEQSDIFNQISVASVEGDSGSGGELAFTVTMKYGEQK